MKVWEVFFWPIAILALVGAALGDEEGGDLETTIEGSGGCPIAQQDPKLMKDVFLNRLGRCFTSIDMKKLNEVDDLGGFETFFREFCQKEEEFDRCLSVSTEDSSLCLTETQRNDVQFVVDTYKNALKHGCVKDGEYISNVLHSLFIVDNGTSSNETSNNSISECIGTAIAIRDADSLDSKSLQFYQEFKEFKKCIIKKLSGDNKAVFEALFMLNGIMRSMGCPHPEHKTRVLCKTLDNIAPTQDLQCVFEEPTYKMFFDMGIQCGLANVEKVDVDTLDDLRTIEEFRTFFKSYCKIRPSIGQCFSDLSVHSEICQNQTSHQMFVIFHDFVESVLETGCKEDGNVFAAIIDGIVNDDAHRFDRRRAKNCTQEAVEKHTSHSSTTSSESDKTMLAYRTVESLKNCMVNNISEENAFKKLLISSTNEILNHMKCIQPDIGGLVTCETIIPRP